MSSYEDRLSERRNKYKDPNKESKQETKVTPADTSKYDERMSQRKAKYSDKKDEIDDSFIDSFLTDARKYANEGGGLSAKLGVDTSSSIYKNRKETAEDLRSRSLAISRYLEQNKDSVPEDYYTTLKSYLDNFDQYTSQSLYSTYRADKFYSQFDSEEAYNKWLQYSTPENRQEQYEKNKVRLEELKQQKRESMSNIQPGTSAYLTGGTTSSSAPYGAAQQNQQVSQYSSDIDKEMAQIKKEMRLYEIGETDEAGNYYGFKTADDYGKYLNDNAFVSASENRNFQNADKAALDEYDASQSEGSNALSNGGYFDDEGNIRDVYGKIVQSASGPEVQDKLGMYLSASKEDIEEAYTILSAVNGAYETTWANIMQEGDVKRWKHLKDDELQIYYGLLNTEGQEAAYRYLDAMEVELGRREMKDIYAAIEESSGLEQVMLNVASVPLNMIGGIAAVVDNAGRMVSGKDLNPYSRAQSLLSSGNYIRYNTAQEIDAATGNKEIPGLGFSWGDAYQAGMSMVDSLVGAKIGGKAYQAVMSMGAASSEMARLYSQGASMDQMVLGSVAAGAAEWVFEKYSIENLDNIKKLINMKPAKLRLFLKNAFIQGGIEMSEEAATEFANILTNGLIMQSESDWANALEANGGDYGKAIKEMAIRIGNAGLGGFLSGMGSGFFQQGMQYGAQQQENKKIGSYISGANSTDDLLALAMDMASGESGKAQKDLKNQSQRIMDDGFLTKGGKNKAIGRLYNTVQSVVTEQNISEISTALQEKGFSKKDATAIAGAVAVQASGLELTDKQQKVLDKFGNNEDVKGVLSEILDNEESGINQRAKNVAQFEFGALRNHIISSIEKELPGQDNAGASDNVDVQTKNGTEGSYEVSADGKTILNSTGEIVNIQEVADIQDGKMTLRLDDGSTVDASEVSYASKDEALVYETVAQMGASVKAANILVKGFQSAEGLSASTYAHGIEEAFRYGKLGIPERELAKSTFASKLNAGQQEYVYRQGKKAAGKQVAKEQATVLKNRAAAEAATAGKVSSRSYQAILEEGITEEELNESQKVSYHLAGQVAEAAKVNIRVYAGKTGEWGYYNPNTDEIHLNLNATNKSRKSMMAFTLGHELVHRAKKGSPAKYKAFANFLMEEYSKNGASVDEMIAEQMDAAKEHNIEMTPDEAFEEVVCDACQRMLVDTDAGKKLAEFGAQSKENKSFLDNLKQWIEEFLDKLRTIFAGVDSDSLAAKEFNKFDAAVKQILADMYVDMTIDAGNNLSTIQNAFGKGTVVKTNEHGEFTMASSQDGSERLFNLTTWNNGGRETLEATLLREGYTKDEVKTALTIMDEKQRLVQNIANELNDNGKLAFPEQGRINEATLTTDLKDGHSVLSALVSNGDYPVNIDLLMVCKKRKAYQRVINRLCETGMIQQATVDALAIAEINKILGKYGFETACLGCFVESRRLRIQEWAQTICKEWNAEVKKRNPNAKAFGFGKGEAALTTEEVMKIIGELESGGAKNDKGNLNLGQGSAVKRMGVLLDKVPSLRRTLSIEDLITPDGLSSLRSFDSNLFSMVKSRYGSNSPKFVQEFNPYNHELAMYGKVPSEYKSLREYLYAIGGARMQSFSDFIVENWFDYCQIVADLAARKLPMHTYTKEIALAKLFGLTGIKINMSLIPDIDRSLGKEFAGLTRNEKGELELIWADKDRFKKTGGKSYMQSINFADAMALQEDPRYSANVGTIAVGVSDRHIETMLADPRIRMVIPYHSSGMNPIFADLMGTSYYKDYTNFQNTTVKQIYNSKGQPVSVKLEKAQNDKLVSGFQFNTVLQEMGDARAAAQAYKDWCADASKHTITIKGETYTAELTPKFDDFSGHENYYKLLEDFNTYDCISEQAAPQGDVQQIYPEDFDDILKAELKAQEGHRQKQEASQAFDKAMNEIEGYLKNHTKADTVHYAQQHGIKLSKKDSKLDAADKAKLKKLQEDGASFKLPMVDSDGSQLSEDQQKFFADSKVRDEQGRLIPMYHGTNNPDFTVFDPQKSDDQVSLFFTSDPDVANTYTQLQDKGRDVDPYNLITKKSSAKQFNAAQERVGGGLRVVKITSEWIQEMKGKAKKSATRLFGVANKYADLLEYNNSTGMFTPSIERIRDITSNGVENLKAHDIPVLRKAMGDAQQRSFFARDHKGAEKEIRRIWSDNFKLFDEAWNYKIAASTPDSAMGQYTYTEIFSDGTFLVDRNLDFQGHIIPGTEKEMVAKAIDRMQWVEDHNLGNRYKVYLNLVNPYIIDATVDYSGKMDYVTLEHNLGKWSVSFENEEIGFDKRMTAAEFDAFVDSAFDAKTTAKIKAQIEENNEAHKRDWAEFAFDPSEVWHHIELQDVNIKHHEPGNWNALRFNGKDDAKTREVSAWAKENGYDGVIFKNMKDAGGYAFQKGRGGSTVAVAFSSEQVKSVDNQHPTANQDIRYKLPKKITMSMTDSERTEILKDKVITAEVYDGQADQTIEAEKENLKSHRDNLIKSALLKIGEEFGVFTDYSISDVAIDIRLSRGNLKESVSKKVDPIQIAKLIPVLRTAVENAVGVECHANRYFYDNDTVMFENLIGGYVDGTFFVPVRFGLKHSVSGKATLYLIVDQEKIDIKKIKAEVAKATAVQEYRPKTSRSAFNISLASIVPFVNGKDLLRYLPDDILNSQQKEAKYEAMAETVVYTNNKNDRKFIEYIRAWKLSSAKQMVEQAAKVAGYTIKAFHQTGAVFTEFSTDNPVAGKNDSETPNGIFFKTNDHDIGLGGGIQMAVYLKADNMLHFADRKEANAWYCENVPGYDALQKELEKALQPYLDKIDAITEQEWDETKSDEEIDALFEEEDRVIKAMGKVEDSYRAKLRKLLDKYFLTGKSGYDGIELDYDGHRWVNGKREDVHTYIVFNPEQAKSADVITYDDHGDIIPISQRFDSEKKDIRYKLPVGEDTSPRALLANAFESVAQNDIERNRLQEYKDKIDLINAEERKLSELKAQIKELSFAKGPKDTKKIRELQFEANQTANRISVYDKQLLRLEASAPLQNVLTREKDMARKRAEQKGKEALAAYREKSAKTQRALMDRYEQSRKRAVENREKTAMRHKIQNVVGELNNLLLHGDKKRHVPENLKKAVADALALVNMDTVGAEERAAKYAALIAKETDPDKIDAYTVTMENILRQGEKMGQRLKELRDAYEEFQESDDPDIANAYDPVIAGCLKELAGSIGNTSLRNMSIEQLSDVYDMYRMVLTRVRDANKTLLDNIKENISNLASRVIGEVRMTGGEHKYRAAVLDPARKFLWNNMKPVYAMEWIGSSTLTKVFNNVRAGEDTWAKDVAEAREYYLEQSHKYGYDSWDFKKKHRFTSASDLDFELTLEQILSLYAYSKREQAHDHLRLGGFVFDSNIETVKENGSKVLKYKVNTADAHQITPEILAQIIGTLTSEQMGFVDEMQDYLSTVMGAKGNEVTMKMYGVKLFREKHYFPLKSAKQFMFEQNEVSGEVKIKNSGFTNKVVAKANNPVILSNFMDVWAGHVNDMSMYHSFVLPLEDFNRVFNYNSPKKDNEPSVSVKGTIQNAYSPAAVNYVKNMITDLNGGARTDSTTGVINKMMGLFKKGAVFASASVVVQQPSAIARAAALVDTKYFIGPKVDHKRHKELWDEVKQYAPVAIIKEMGYFDTNMGKSTQDFITGKEYSGFSEKMKALVTDGDYRDEVLSKAPALADEIAWCSIWEAVKREMHDKHPGLDVKGEPFLMLAGSRFTEVITKTQVYDSVLSRSANMRSKDTGMKMATAFMAEPTTSINMIADALQQGKRGGKEGRRYCRKTVGAVIASVVLNSFLVAWVQAARDDDEDESYMEKYVGSFTAEMLDGMNPLTYIPFIKDIVSIVQGYDVERSDMSVISDIVNAVRKLSSDKASGWKKVEDFAGSICQVFGLPAKNIMRDVRGMWQAFDTIINGEKTTAMGIGYAVKEAVTGKSVSKQDQLYEAMLAGDAQHTARVKARYDDEDSANAAIRQAIKNDFLDGEIDSNTAMDRMVKYAGMTSKEAHWKMDAWEYRKSNGTDEGYGKYNDFFEAVKTGKNLKAVIKEYTDNGVKKDTLSSQITSHFKADYIKMSASERAKIKGYLINAFEQCGVDRKKAEERLADWDFEAKYGFSYADRGEAYRNRTITRSQLMEVLITYGGMTEDEAMRYIDEQDFQAATGYAYSDKVNAYKSGYLSADTLKTALVDIGGLSEVAADLQIEAYDWEAQGFGESVTWEAVRDYYEHCAPFDVPKDVYLYIRSVSNSTKNDVDEETGRTIYYSAMKAVMAEIEAQVSLTPAQKTAIARSLGWSEKNIRKYKLW